MGGQTNQFAELQDRIAALESINRALMGRVERSVDSFGNSFSLFESNILLQNVVSERTQQLEQTNNRLLSEIRERKQAEQRIMESLREKEVLLKEVHHRVKNNLQIITSLLSLQAGNIDDPRMVAMFRDSQGRVKSMALIHEKLYQSENLSEINLADYVDGLCKYLMSTVSGNLGRVTIRNQVEEIRLAIDLAIPCGLVINELVTNSLKYAFPEQRCGEVIVSSRIVDERDVVLSVCDDGVGLPEGFDYSSTATLGMQLVHSLVRQLDGELRIAGQPGARFTIRFARERHKLAKEEGAHV